MLWTVSMWARRHATDFARFKDGGGNEAEDSRHRRDASRALLQLTMPKKRRGLVSASVTGEMLQSVVDEDGTVVEVMPEHCLDRMLALRLRRQRTRHLPHEHGLQGLPCWH